MTQLLQSRDSWRSPRVRLNDITPAVLRLPNGKHSRGQLETISLTGGLLNMTNMLGQGSRIRLMFLTQNGPVTGSAEMLSPVATFRQPFRFVALEAEDQRRLRAVVHSSSQPFADPVEQAWIQKYRAALAQQKPRRRGVFRVVLGMLAGTLCLGSALYLLSSHLLK
ncbi:MAG TPA: hypothetical protein VMH04_12770 [Candidatus Solibacter sp.]|nr:hypothetical protein [Candidatus Solibacter sp.]